MPSKLAATIDALSELLMRIGLLLLAGLILVNGIEVVARYLLSAPTIWAYDLATLLNGAIFMLGLGYTLRVGGHVRIDVLSSRLPLGLRRGVIAGFFLLLAGPCLALLAAVAAGETLAAIESGERLLSAWEPPLWPGYLAVTIGLAGLLLQCLVTGLRALGRGGDPLAPAGASDMPEAGRSL